MNEQEFGSAPIGKLFVRCTVPAMVGMGFSAIYSITDGIFVGHFIGQEALAAVNLVMPIIMIITALADMVATGSSVRISILLGRGDDKEANRVFTVCIGLIAAIATVFGLLGCLFARQVISLMGAEGMTADYAVEYLRVFALFMPFCCIYYSTDNYLRVCGQVNLSMTINIVCSLLNIVLDVLLIVVLEQGLWAAAVASCASMSIGAVWSLVPFVRRKLPLVFSKGWIDAGQCGEWLLGVLCQHRRFVVCRRRQHCTIASRRLYRCGCRCHCGICGEPYRHGHPQYDRCPATRHQLLFRCRTIAANETHPAGGDECRSHIVAPVDALPDVWRTPAAAVLHQGRRRGSLCTQHPCYATLCLQLSRVVD